MKVIREQVAKKAHHFYTAMGVSCALAVIGILDWHHHVMHWVYAVCETFVEEKTGHGGQ